MSIFNVDLQDDKGNSYQPMANPKSKAEFTQASSRENINSGESHETIFGKMKKWFSDMGSSAFNAIANNLTTMVAGFALDARQGKVLKDEINQISSDFISDIYIGDDGKIHKVQGGADSVLPFNNKIKWLYEDFEFSKSGNTHISSNHVVVIETGITGKVLWETIFPMIFYTSSSGTASNYLGVHYDSDTGRLTIDGCYSGGIQLNIGYI